MTLTCSIHLLQTNVWQNIPAEYFAVELNRITCGEFKLTVTTLCECFHVVNMVHIFNLKYKSLLDFSLISSVHSTFFLPFFSQGIDPDLSKSNSKTLNIRLFQAKFAYIYKGFRGKKNCMTLRAGEKENDAMISHLLNSAQWTLMLTSNKKWPKCTWSHLFTKQHH